MQNRIQAQWVCSRERRIALYKHTPYVCGFYWTVLRHWSQLVPNMSNGINSSINRVYVHAWTLCCFYTLVNLQALVYDTLPSTTAVFSYVIESRKMSANEQFFVGAQILVSLLQTTLTKKFKKGVSFIAANKGYTSTNKTKIVWIQTELVFFFLYPGWMCLMFTCVLWR